MTFGTLILSFIATVASNATSSKTNLRTDDTNPEDLKVKGWKVIFLIHIYQEILHKYDRNKKTDFIYEYKNHFFFLVDFSIWKEHIND